MKKIFSVLLSLIMLCSYCTVWADSSDMSLYISVSGSDRNTGLSKNSPLKTLSAVNSKIISCRKNYPDRHINVYFMGGVYYIDTFNNLDNGSDITFQPYGGEEVVLKGSILLDNGRFKKVTDEKVLSKLSNNAVGNIYQMDLYDKFSYFDEPETADHGNDNPSYYSLFKNDSEQTLARYPNEGYMTAEVENAQEGSIRVPEEKARLWAGAEQTIRLNGYLCWDWCYIRNYIKNIDTEKSTISFELNRTCSAEVNKVNKFYVNDLIEELDAEGEWYIDRAKKILYYYPLNGVISSDQYEISSLKTPIMRFYNGKNITFKDLNFENTKECAVLLLDSEDILFDNCSFKNIGKTAIEAERVSNMTVNGCSFYNMAVRGITLNGGDSDMLVSGNNVIVNNTFEKMGQVQRSYAGAVNIIGDGNIVANNKMTDMPHVAVQFVGTTNKIIYNDISKTCRDSGDMGAIYSGRSLVYRGNDIAYNYIHDIVSEWSDYEVIPGIYLDDRLSGISVFGNVIKNAKQGIFVGAGSDNCIHDNIFLDCKSAVTVISGGNSDTGASHLYDEAITFIAGHQNYTDKFPTLKYIDSSKTFPRGNFIYDNLSVNSGFEVYNDREYPYVRYGVGERMNRRYNNTRADSFNEFSDSNNNDYTIAKDSTLLLTTPYLADIDFSEIGTGKNSISKFNSLNNAYLEAIASDITDAINNFENTITYGNYSALEKVFEMFALAEVNDINTSEFKDLNNYKKYYDEYVYFNNYACTMIDMSSMYNANSIYDSDPKYMGNAGYAGSFYYPEFIRNKNISWDREWTEETVYNTLTLNGVKFRLKAVDFSRDRDACCVFWNLGEESAYTRIDVEDDIYDSIEFLANSDRPTNPASKLGIILNYEDGSREVKEYRLSYFYNEYGESGRGIKSVSTSPDGMLNTYGYITHYSVPTNKAKKLLSIDIVNDKYDFVKNADGSYSTDENGEYRFSVSSETDRMNYSHTAAIYAISTMKGYDKQEEHESYTLSNIAFYDRDNKSLEYFYNAPNGEFTVEAKTIKNTGEVPEIILALYDQNNKPVSIKKADINENGDIHAEFKIDMTMNGEWKLTGFIWDSVKGMFPITEKQKL